VPGDLSGGDMEQHETQDAFHHGYRLTNVHGRIQPNQREEAIRMWLDEGVLPEPEARRRADEIVYLIHAPDGGLIGVNTVYSADFPGSDERFYFYRTFVRAPSRGDAGLGRAVLRLTWDFLKSQASQTRPAGLIIVTENPKLMRPGAVGKLTEAGFNRLGRDARGRDIWCRRFDGRPFGTSLPGTQTQV
jgi:hypothetical protein